MTLNSTHAAWLVFAGSVVTALIPVVANSPLPAWVGPALLLLSAVLHATLPDAPAGAGLTGVKQ